MKSMRNSILEKIPGVLVAKPSAAIYLVIDFKNICNTNFDSNDFIKFCAQNGSVSYNGIKYTLFLHL